MKKLVYFLSLVLVFALCGCQGRLKLVMHNETGNPLVVLSDGREYAVPAQGEIRISSPSDRVLFLQAGQMSYRFAFPFGPRPHTINDYIDGPHLTVNVRIKSLTEIQIIPQSGSEGKEVLSVTGERIDTGR